MAGIYGILSQQKLDVSNIYNNFYSSTLDNIINEEFKYNNFFYGRSVIDKFLDDRVLYEDNDLIIGFEGIFFNKETKKSFDTIKEWYIKKGIDLVEDIKGQFCGFIYDKKLDKLYIYNDHLSTKALYIFKNDEVFIFASELKVITKLLFDLSIKKELDYDAVYSMLTFGYMLEDITYEKSTKKLKYATILEIDKNFKRTDKHYFKFEKKENFDISKDEIIESIDNLLLKSVAECWQKDDEYNYQHYSFLSGGLDSRVNLFLAKELGYKDVLTMTFSQSKSSDATIAEKISNKENFKHLFYSLDNGKFLEKNLERYILANDGLAILSGSASGYDLLSTLSHKNFGALHTGQIGDLLFGSYVKNNFIVQTAMISNKVDLLNKISFIEKYNNEYNNNSEIFGYEERVINGTFNGDRTASHFTDMLSPFYSKDLINFCLSIPNTYKKDEAIYLDWFNSKHKNISNYIWESAGIKPKNIAYVKIAKQVKRYKNGLLRRMNFNINDMNPFDIWLRENTNILKNLDAIFNQNINLVKNKALKDLLEDMFNTDIKYNHYGRNNQFLVITVLLGYVLHFEDSKLK
jgi:asparagine synthase (glutamine-hydrolysing)